MRSEYSANEMMAKTKVGKALGILGAFLES